MMIAFLQKFVKRFHRGLVPEFINPNSHCGNIATKQEMLMLIKIMQSKFHGVS